MDRERKQQQQNKEKMDSAYASFSLLHWTQSNIPRGSQLDHRPQRWPANGERGPSDRHFIHSPRVWATGAGLVRSAVQHYWSLPLSVMLGMFCNTRSLKKRDSETQTCSCWDDFKNNCNNTPDERVHISCSTDPNIPRSAVLHDKLFANIFQYVVTSCPHMGFWQICHSYCSLSSIFIISAIH